MDRFLQGDRVDKAAQGIPQDIVGLGNSLDTVWEDIPVDIFHQGNR